MADNVRPDAVLSAHPLLSAEIDRLRARLAKVEAERDEALELAEEVIPYAGEYFDEKWALTERLTELKVRAAARGEDDR